MIASCQGKESSHHRPNRDKAKPKRVGSCKMMQKARLSREKKNLSMGQFWPKGVAMSNILTILFGMKKNADDARGKGASLGAMGAGSKGYKDAQDELEKIDNPDEEKKDSK